MIEFNGELSNKCRNYIRKKAIKLIAISNLAFILSLIALIIIAWIILDIWFIAIISIVLVVLIGAVFLVSNIKSIKSKMPARITIKDGIIELEGESAYQGQTKYVDPNDIIANDNPVPRPFLSRNIRTINLKVAPTLTENIDDKKHSSRRINNVKKVIDMGDWYHIVFYFGHKCAFYVCQKDLLVSGNTKEFCKLFEGKVLAAKNT